MDGRIITICDAETDRLDLSYRRLYTLATTENRTPDDILNSASSTSDELTKRCNQLTVDSMKTTLAIPFVRSTPTSALGLTIVSEKMPALSEVATDNWSRAVIEKAFTPEQALETVKAEWDKLGYQEMKQAFNEKAKTVK